MICLPVDVSPVKETLAIRGLAAIAWPTDPPGPVTTLSTPGGRISAIRPARIRRVSGVFDAGLMTVQLPAASAGAIFHAPISSGKFHGIIWPTTPSGSLKWYAIVSLSIVEIAPSSALMQPEKYRK